MVKTGLHFDNGHFYPEMNTHTYAHLEGCRMYEKLYADNIKLLWYWANRYANACRLQAGVDLEDLVQSGFLAVIEAQKTFEILNQHIMSIVSGAANGGCGGSCSSCSGCH